MTGFSLSYVRVSFNEKRSRRVLPKTSSYTERDFKLLMSNLKCIYWILLIRADHSRMVYKNQQLFQWLNNFQKGPKSSKILITESASILRHILFYADKFVDFRFQLSNCDHPINACVKMYTKILIEIHIYTFTLLCAHTCWLMTSTFCVLETCFFSHSLALWDGSTRKGHITPYKGKKNLKQHF